MTGSSAAFLITLNLLVKKWCRSHKRTLTCFRSHFVQEKQLATTLSNIHQLTTFPTSLIMISKLYPPSSPPNTHNKQLQVTQHCWRMEKKMKWLPLPNPPPTPKNSQFVRERPAGRLLYIVLGTGGSASRSLREINPNTQIHSTDLSRKCAYVNIVILAPNPNHQCHHTDQGKTWKF